MNYWKCAQCHGTGKDIDYWTGKARVIKCNECDGTGNALVDGAAERHKRRIFEIENASTPPGAET